MITIKLPLSCLDNSFNQTLKELQRIQSNITRIAYNRFQDNLTENQISKYIKNILNLKIGSWLNQSAVKDAKQILKTFKNQRIVFGSRHNLKQYLTKKISKEQFKEKRLRPLYSIGEANQKGNRYFKLDLLHNQIIFKPNRKQHFALKLPKLRTNYLRQLHWLEAQAAKKLIPFSVQLTKDFICITFEEKELDKIESIENRVISIDLNPNSIGYFICNWKESNRAVLDSGIIDLKKLNEPLKKASSSKEQLYQNNKREFELHQVVKFLIERAKHFRCEKFVVEDLNIKARDHNKGRVFNRTVNNNWSRALILNTIKKRCKAFSIKFIEINPVYSSIIGNALYINYPDPINAAIEINRRGQFKYQKGKFYPEIPNKDILNEQWKQTLEKSFESWKDLAGWLKNSKVKYRVSMDGFKDHLLFSSLRHINSNTYLYVFR